MALSAEVAVRDVYRPVHVRLVLAHPASVVRTRERRLSRAVSYLTARVALPRRVTRIHSLDGDLETTVEAGGTTITIRLPKPA